MSVLNPAARDLERRKQVKLRIRNDLSITAQKYEGRTFYVVKDPVALRYYRFKEQERFLLRFMDGRKTLEDARVAYERQFRPERLTLEDLEGFAQQLLTAGLVQNESPIAGKQLFDRRKKKKRGQLMRSLTNVMYLKIPLYDPEKLLQRLLKYTSFFFSIWFFLLSLVLMTSALLLVGLHFETFIDKLPSYHEFFSFKNVALLWIALGAVKIIHEFGHGISCKKFGGEVHEMGLLFLVFSPCLYCNVSDAWTLPNKWKRIVISAAGIYVELVIAAIATFVWWYTPTEPFANNMALSLMVVCSVSTILFNANPLMRFDGYYVLSDLIEIPNLREKSNRYLGRLFTTHCLGIEAQPEPYMARWRRILFVTYAIAAYLYRWFITFVILYFLYTFLKPYKLGVISGMLAMAAFASMIGWPMYRMIKNVRRRGRLPDMKPVRVTITCMVFLGLFLTFLFVPMPVSRVRTHGVVMVKPEATEPVHLPAYATAASDGTPIDAPVVLTELLVRDGQEIKRPGEPLAVVTIEQFGIDYQEAVENYLSEDTIRRTIETTNVSAKARSELRAFIEDARTKMKSAQADQDRLERLYPRVRDLKKGEIVVTAPRRGIVMGLPKREEIGKQWDDAQRPLCKIGDPRHLEVVFAVSPGDFYLLQDNLREKGNDPRKLPVTIRVQGLGDQEWRGHLSHLNPRDSVEIPFELSNRAGGPVPVKGNDAQRNVPQSQVFLAKVAIHNPSAAIHPGTRAQIKVHCKHRTCAWYLWRTVNDVFNLRL